MQTAYKVLAIAVLLIFLLAFVRAVAYKIKTNSYSSLMSLLSWPGYLVASSFYGYLAWLMFAYIQLFVPVLNYTSIWVWVVAFIMEDFCFYWFHRFSHKLSVFWALHSVHHSGEVYDLSLGFRQSWFPFVALLFYVPLAFAGIPFGVFIIVHAASLLYQSVLHIEKINYPKIMALVLNTPQHHRIHHSRETQYLDKNFGGVTLLWDRLFGTYQPAGANTTYGIHGRSEPDTLAMTQFGEIIRIFSFQTIQPADTVNRKFLRFLLTVPLFLVSSGFLVWTIVNPYWFLGVNK